MPIKFLRRFYIVGTTLLEIANILLTPFSQIAFLNFTWGQVIHVIVIISLATLLIQTEIEKMKWPDLRIRPTVSNQLAILEIRNNGGISKFKAVAKVIKGHRDFLNIPYALVWEPMGAEAEIGKDGIGKLIIAHQKPIHNDPLVIGLIMPILTNNGVQELPLVNWPLGTMREIRTDKPPDDIDLEISITADKNMKKKFSRLVFRLSQKTITNLQFEYMGSKMRKLELDKCGYLK